MPMTPGNNLSDAGSPAPESNGNSTSLRKRVACERCKLRKAKCDRQLPKCERCRDAAVPCEYARTRRPPGFPVGHRQLLETKIRRLEGEISRLRGGGENGEIISTESPNPDPTLCSSATATSRNIVTNPRDTRQSASNVPQHHDEDQTQSRPPSNVGQASDSADDTTAWKEKHPLAPTVVRTGRIKELKPPTDLVLSLTSLYFRHIHHWLPFLDVKHIFADHVAVGEPSLITYALFGATLQYSQDPRLTQSSRDAFWKYCKRTILVEALEEPSYHTLEALTILALDLSGMTNGPQVWGVLAVVVKMAQQLETSGSGHALRLSSAAEEASVSDVNSIRRLFWAIYALDCYVSITTRHASDMSTQVMQNLLPFRSALWHEGNNNNSSGQSSLNTGFGGFDGHQQPSPDSSSSVSMTAPTTQVIFSYQLELLDISRRLHSLYVDYLTFESNSEIPPDEWLQSMVDWASAMDTWFTQLPPALRIGTIDTRIEFEDHQQQKRRVSPLVATLNVYYYALKIYLHGLGDFMTRQHDGGCFATFSEDNRMQCIKSIESLTQIVSILPRGLCADRLGWPFAWALWVGARYCLASRYHNRPLAQDYFDKLVHYLGGMSKYWQVASHYLRLLRITQDELAELGTPGNQAAPSQLLLSVVDWRVASCEVEDQGRVDPILRPSGLAPLAKGIELYDMEMLLGGSGLEVPQLSHHAAAGGYTAMTPEEMTNWFSVSSMRSEQEGLQQGMGEYGLGHGYGG